MIIPSYVRMIAVVALMALLAGGVRYVYSKGADSVRVQWDAEKLAAENQSEVLRLARQSVIGNKAVEYKAKSEKVRYITKTIIKEVEKYVPNTLPMLPGSFRVYHDAAAAGEEIDDSKIINAAPVAPALVARTVARNYGNCNDEKFRLETLQAIIRKLGVEVEE